MAVTYTPALANALYPNFVGVNFQERNNYTAHDPVRVTAKYFLVPVQNELLAHQEALAGGLTALNVRNETGAQLDKGTLVYLSGWNSTEDRHLVSKADASDSAKLAEFVLNANIADNANGSAFAYKTVTDLDTSGAASEGDDVYLSAATPGGFVFTAPGGANWDQKLGTVKVKNGSTGEIIFFIGGAQGGSKAIAIAEKGAFSISEENLVLIQEFST